MFERESMMFLKVSYANQLHTFTFMHLADAFIQSDLHYIQVIHFWSICVFPGN